jgi:hypothetical protein
MKVAFPNLAHIIVDQMATKQHVFIGWSGERSRLLAEVLARWLPELIQPIRVWMSEVAVEKGNVWTEEIRTVLETTQMGLFCMTPENQDSAWMAFEAGMLVASDARVCTLLFGLTADDLGGPLAPFQSTAFDRADVRTLLSTINVSVGEGSIPERTLESQFERLWPTIRDDVRNVLERALQPDPTSFRHVINAISQSTTDHPSVGDVAHFAGGFESHQLYGVGTQVASKRLLVWGRKNRKLMDKEYQAFLASIAARPDFDLRLLFLDPRSDPAIIAEAHSDPHFSDHLRASLETATELFKAHGMNPDAHCRLYRRRRYLHVLVLDDAVLFTPVLAGPEGQALPLTKAPFTVVSAAVGFGAQVVRTFEAEWQAGDPISSALVGS